MKPLEMMRSNGSPNADRAFSLVELLCVIAIVATLSVLANAAVMHIERAQRLSHAGGLLRTQIHLARQLAVTESRKIFLQFGKVQESQWGIQLFGYDSQGTLSPLSSIARMPEGIDVASDSGMTTVSETSQCRIKGVSTGKELQFRGNGSLVHPSTSSCLVSVVFEQGGTGNFITLQIDPVTGQVVTFQP